MENDGLLFGCVGFESVGPVLDEFEPRQPMLVFEFLQALVLVVADEDVDVLRHGQR